MNISADIWASVGSGDLSDQRLDRLAGPIPSPAPWLGAVHRRLRESMVPSGKELDNDGRWLSKEAAFAANAFFSSLSDVLPGEPYVYSSNDGDVVAEFKAPYGRMTSVVSSNGVVTLATLRNDEPIVRNLRFGDHGYGAMRNELRSLTAMLVTGRRRGAMDP